jgi:small subunit ribosomal protein S20
MATHQSAEKRHRQSLKRNERNRSAKSALRTAVKTTLGLAEAGKTEEAQKSAAKTMSMLDKAANKGLYHPKNVQRRISRIFKRINSANKSA